MVSVYYDGGVLTTVMEERVSYAVSSLPQSLL